MLLPVLSYSVFSLSLFLLVSLSPLIDLLSSSLASARVLTNDDESKYVAQQTDTHTIYCYYVHYFVYVQSVWVPNLCHWYDRQMIRILSNTTSFSFKRKMLFSYYLCNHDWWKRAEYLYVLLLSTTIQNKKK